MYEGQPIICQKIIEENWLEYLAFTKDKAAKEEELNKKRAEKLREFENTDPRVGTKLADVPQVADYRWYDISIQSFWNWYISNKI